MSLGAAIKKARKEAGLTQKALAERVGLSLITIQQYEANKRTPKSETLESIALALGVEVSELAAEKSISPQQIPFMLGMSDRNATLYGDSLVFAVSMSELNKDGHTMLERYLDYLKTVPEYKAGNFSAFAARYTENTAEQCRELAKRYKELSQTAEAVSENLLILADKIDAHGGLPTAPPTDGSV